MPHGCCRDIEHSAAWGKLVRRFQVPDLLFFTLGASLTFALLRLRLAAVANNRPCWPALVANSLRPRTREAYDARDRDPRLRFQMNLEEESNCRGECNEAPDQTIPRFPNLSAATTLRFRNAWNHSRCGKLHGPVAGSVSPGGGRRRRKRVVSIAEHARDGRRAARRAAESIGYRAYLL